MASGWYFYDNDPTDEWEGNWYYCNQNGTVYDGWLLDGGQWYFLVEGYMIKNTAFSPGLYFETEDETTWVFDESGHLLYGGWHWHEYEMKMVWDSGHTLMPTVPDITDGFGKTITGTTSIMAT